MSVVKAYNLYLNSENGIRLGTGSDYIKWNLQNKLMLTDKRNHFTVRVLHSNIPYSFKQTPHIIVVGSYVHSAVTYPFSFTIPAGNYSMTDLNKAFTNGFLGLSHPHTWDLSVVYNSGLGKNTYTFTSNQPFTFSFTFNNYWRSAGFKNSDTLSFSNVAGLTSTRHPIVNRVNSLLVRSDNLTQDHGSQEILIDDLDTMEVSDILAKIPIYTGSNSYIIYQGDESNPAVHITNQDISYIQLYLTSNISYTLDLNELEWTCALRIEEIESKKPTEQMDYKENQDALQMLATIKESILQELETTRSQLIEN